jgi:hypothetical protein
LLSCQKGLTVSVIAVDSDVYARRRAFEVSIVSAALDLAGAYRSHEVGRTTLMRGLEERIAGGVRGVANGYGQRMAFIVFVIGAFIHGALGYLRNIYSHDIPPSV